MKAPIPAAVLDRAVLRILDALDCSSVEWEIERILRMGACATDGRPWVQEAARRFGVNANMLARRMRDAGAPSPKVLLRWGRLLAVLHAWEPGHGGYRPHPNALPQVARRYGWSNGSCDVSRVMKIATGLSPTEWAKRGADLDDLCDLVVERWRARSGVAT